MSRSRALFVLVGFTSLAGAVAILAIPGIEAALPVDPLVERVGADFYLLVPLGAVALLSALLLTLRLFKREVHETTPPAVEAVDRWRPGTQIDDRLDSLPRFRTGRAHRHIHSRIRALAVETISQHEGCSRADARDRVARGEWTDNSVASSFLRHPEFVPPAWHVRLRSVFRPTHWYRWRVAETLAAIERNGARSR